MMILRLFRHVRDTFRVLSGRDTEVRDMTLNLQKEIVRMQENTIIQKKICEETALAQVRQLVKEIKDLEKHLQEAETAAVEQVNRIAKEAKEHLEADLIAEEELMLKAFEDNKEAIMEKILKYDASLESLRQLPSAVNETSIPADDLHGEAKKQVDKVHNSSN